MKLIVGVGLAVLLLIVIIVVLVVVLKEDKKDCVGDWGEYGDCNVSCGNGVKEKVYTITQEKVGSGLECDQIEGQIAFQPCDTGVICDISLATDLDNFKSRFCDTEICSTEYEGYTCSSTHTPTTPPNPNADIKDSFEECKIACSEKHPDKLDIVAFYNSTDSDDRPGLCDCRESTCMDAPSDDQDHSGRFTVPASTETTLGYAHCSSCEEEEEGMNTSVDGAL